MVLLIVPENAMGHTPSTHVGFVMVILRAMLTVMPTVKEHVTETLLRIRAAYVEAQAGHVPRLRARIPSDAMVNADQMQYSMTATYAEEIVPLAMAVGIVTHAIMVV
jgi:hypothetical protein